MERTSPRRRFTGGAALALCLMLCLPAAAEDRVVLRTLFQDVVPKFLIQTGGRHGGLCWEIMQLIEAKSPVRFSHPDSLVPLIRVSAELAQGDIDIEVGLQKTPERERDMVFGEALYRVRTVAVCRVGDTPDFASLADLARLDPRRGQILTVWGTGIAQLLAGFPGLSLDDQAKSAEAGLLKLLAGRGRVFIYHNLSVMYLLKDPRFAGKLAPVPFDFGESALEDTWQYVVFSKKLDPAVAGLVNAAIRQARQSGELAAITDRWLE